MIAVIPALCDGGGCLYEGNFIIVVVIPVGIAAGASPITCAEAPFCVSYNSPIRSFIASCPGIAGEPVGVHGVPTRVACGMNREDGKLDKEK